MLKNYYKFNEKEAQKLTQWQSLPEESQKLYKFLVEAGIFEEGHIIKLDDDDEKKIAKKLFLRDKSKATTYDISEAEQRFQIGINQLIFHGLICVYKDKNDRPIILFPLLGLYKIDEIEREKAFKNR